MKQKNKLFFGRVIFVITITLIILLILDINLHQKYGLTSDVPYHLSIINDIIKNHEIPQKNSLTHIDQASDPVGFHLWETSVINLSGIYKNRFYFNSNLLLIFICCLLIFAFIRNISNISNEYIAILSLIIILFAGGIGWMLYPQVFSVERSSDVMSNLIEKTGYTTTNLFQEKFYSPIPQALGFVFLFLFLYLFQKKKYLLSAIVMVALSYVHRNTFVFFSILLIFIMISLDKKEIKAILIPGLTLILSFGWNFYPELAASSNRVFLFFSRLSPLITAENVLRLILLASIILFFVFKRRWKESFNKVIFIIITLSIILDAFFRFNQTTFYSIPFYQIAFFLYGPLLIGLLFIKKLKSPNEIYFLLITCLFLTQLNAIFSLLDFERVLIMLFIPLAIIYATLMFTLERKYKVVLLLLFLLMIPGVFVILMNFTSSWYNYSATIDYHYKVLTFIKEKLPEDARVLVSPGFDRGKRKGIIIPGIAERCVYTERSYDWDYFVPDNLIAEGYDESSGLTVDEWMKNEVFYRQNYGSRLLQIAYLFEHPEINLTGTKIKELATHMLVTKTELSKLEPYFTTIYDDGTSCILEI